MLTQGRFLISYQVFDNIPVNNNGQTHVREILKDTISRFQAQYNIQEINPYLQDILQNPGDLVSLAQHHKR
jgi:hypothetical protein